VRAALGRRLGDAERGWVNEMIGVGHAASHAGEHPHAVRRGLEIRYLIGRSRDHEVRAARPVALTDDALRLSETL